VHPRPTPCPFRLVWQPHFDSHEIACMHPRKLNKFGTLQSCIEAAQVYSTTRKKSKHGPLCSPTMQPSPAQRACRAVCARLPVCPPSTHTQPIMVADLSGWTSGAQRGMLPNVARAATGHVCLRACVRACVRVCKNRVGICDLLSQQTPTDTACCTVCSHRKPSLSMDIPVTPHASLCIPTTPFVYLTRLQARYRIP
jgi:hypothetical protein